MSSFQGLEDHYSALESELTLECRRRLMGDVGGGAAASEAEADDSDNDSNRSVEDPTTNTPAPPPPVASGRAVAGGGAAAASSSSSAMWTTSATKQQTAIRPSRPLHRAVPNAAAAASDHSAVPDPYSPYIRIIVLLLAGVFLLNLLLLMKVWQTDKSDTCHPAQPPQPQPHFEPAAAPDNTALEALLQTVNQLSADLQKLKKSRQQEL